MLMGLLGTVIGLIQAFAAVASVNRPEKASMLSASISVAMNNTALASRSRSRCCCATCTRTKTTELVDSLEVASIKFLNTVVERRARPRPVAAAAATAAARQTAPARTAEAPAARLHAHEKEFRPGPPAAAQPRALPRRNDLNIVPMLDVMVILTFF